MIIIEFWLLVAGELADTDDVDDDEETEADMGEDLLYLRRLLRFPLLLLLDFKLLKLFSPACWLK